MRFGVSIAHKKKMSAQSAVVEESCYVIANVNVKIVVKSLDLSSTEI